MWPLLKQVHLEKKKKKPSHRYIMLLLEFREQFLFLCTSTHSYQLPPTCPAASRINRNISPRSLAFHLHWLRTCSSFIAKTSLLKKRQDCSQSVLKLQKILNTAFVNIPPVSTESSNPGDQ